MGRWAHYRAHFYRHQFPYLAYVTPIDAVSTQGPSYRQACVRSGLAVPAHPSTWVISELTSPLGW